VVHLLSRNLLISNQQPAVFGLVTPLFYIDFTELARDYEGDN
jgi:hypothetical protein